MRKQFLLTILCALLCATATAQTFTPVGSAVLSGTLWNLTPGSGCGTNQTGAIWSSHKVDFTRPFEIYFVSQFDTYYSGGADGITVVFGSNLSTSSSPNGIGGGIGVYGSNTQYTSHCFDVEFDTYNNGPGANDIVDDHCAVCYNGNPSVGTTLAGPTAINGITGIKTNTPKNIDIVWDPVTNKLSVYYNCNLVLTCNYNFATMFTDPTSVQWGITGSTGGACSNQYVSDVSDSTPLAIVYDTTCAGQPLTLSGPGGYSNYTWSTGATTSSISVSTAGIYTVKGYGGCYSQSIEYHVYIQPLPNAITGHSKVCVGDTIHLSDATGGGTWNSSNGHATVSGSGVVTGMSQGTSVISYTAKGCSVYDTITINPLPRINPVIADICKGDQYAYLYYTTSGSPLTYTITWTAGTGLSNMSGTLPTLPPISINPVSASVGVHTAILSVTNANNCSFDTTFSFSVHPVPNPIGPDQVCVHSNITLSDAPTGGTWSSNNGNVTVTGGGLVTGVTQGTSIVTYTIGYGCKAKDTVTVHPLPDSGTITYPTIPVHLCIGTSDTLGETAPGGTWLSLNPTVLQITGTSGSHCNVNALSVGTATVLYIVTSAYGCKDTASRVVTVDTNGIDPITGILGVCANSTTQLSDATPGVTWSMGGCPYASIDGSGLVTAGGASGICTVTATLTNACGTFSTWATVVVNMPPYITTKSIVACQQEAQNDGNVQVLDDGSGCIKVCDSSIVRYYAGGVNGASFTWSVIGGTIINNYANDSIDVLWPYLGVPTSITLYANYGNCISQRDICINVIARPHAAFSVLPDLTPATGVVQVCLNSNVSFHDLSTGDPQSQIVSWYWDFGDGTNSAQQNPSHIFSNPGYDTVKLVVKNECNCADTYRVVLRVYSDPGPIIMCTAVECENTTATYSTLPLCGYYYWSVTGGTILSGNGTTNIQVNWNNVDSNGFGYVNLQEPCGGGGTCPDTTVLKVPVVTSGAHIVGPDTICANQMYQYSLPLWPGTQYHWAVLNNFTGVIGTNADHTAVVELPTEGTYTLHAWFENDVKLCGNNLDKTIVVVPPVAVSGDSLVCAGSPETYTLSGSVSSYTYTIKDPFGNVTSGTGTGNTFTTTFGSVGVFELQFSGDFCAPPFKVTTQKTPPHIDSIVGPDTVCLHRVYTYKAYSDNPTMIYNWQITGGTITPASGENTVSVVWTSSGTKQLSVQHTQILPPNCQGPLLVKNITQEVINPNITGDTLPCANAYRNYNSHYTRGEYYDWQLLPNTAGSVMSGNHSSAVTVLWNNVLTPTNVNFIVTVHKCDSIVKDTLAILVEPSPGATLTCINTPICPGTPVLFTASAGGSAYSWSFGDGTTATATTDTITHVFPLNPTNGNQSYTITVVITPDPNQPCPVSGFATASVTIKPGPIAYASVGTPTCADGVTPINVYGTVTNNVSGLVYQWFESGTAITGATNASYITLTSGVFTFSVTASNGCSILSNAADVLYCNNDSVFGGGGPCVCHPTSSVSCNTITLQGEPGGTVLHWYATPGGVGLNPTAFSTSVTYSTPGVYGFALDEAMLCGTAHNSFTDTIPAVVDYNYHILCGAGGATDADEIDLHDHTALLPGYTIDSINWTYGLTGANPVTFLQAPGSYTITETVTIQRPDGTTFVCSQTHTIVLPARPSAGFTSAHDSICEGVPLAFTSTMNTAIVNYQWLFGDNSGVVIQNPQRTYTWDVFKGSPNIDTVRLIVTDSLGCIDTASELVSIFRIPYSGGLGGDQTVCPSAGPVILSYLPDPLTPTPLYYLWSNAAITATITANPSGAYWVTVSDNLGCQFVTAPAHINIIHVPTPLINGKHEYCIGDVVNLSGYAGNGVGYQWYLDGSPDGNTAYVADGSLGIGDHYYQLMLIVTDTLTGDTCMAMSDSFVAHVYTLPDAPVISGNIVSCTPYEYEMTATEPVSGTYNWSNGVYGPTIDVYSGGPYKVWFTNQYGCISNNQAFVPQSPEYYFDYFPSGCYSLCETQFPFTLYGPPGIYFPYWAWYKDGSNAEDGSYTYMQPYTINGNNQISWVLNNGYCSDTSAPMSIAYNPTCTECENTSDHTYLNAKATCTPGNPASYSVDIDMYSPVAGTSYTLGTQNEGPLVLSTGTFTAAGSYMVTVTFTTLQLPPPGDVVIEVQYTFPDGTECFKKQDIPLEPCTWTDEENRQVKTPADTPRLVKPLVNDNTVANGKSGTQLGLIANSLAVFPNPSSGEVTLSYNYGTDSYKQKGLAIYDALGQRINYQVTPDVTGQWKVNTHDWADGVYTIVMEADGAKLQSQRLVVEHH